MTDHLVGENRERSRKILVPLGTRPEIVKLAPVVRALRDQGHEVFCVDTGQHVTPKMSGEIAQELGLVPDQTNVLCDDPDQRVGQIYADAQKIVREHRLDLVLALGDTHTVPAYAMAARRASLPLAHLEAGLRSFNGRSVEELNRRVAGVAAAIHFAPTARARECLLEEGVPLERVFVVGNSAIDNLVVRGLRSLNVDERRGVLVTAHRATNVDEPSRLRRLVKLVNQLAQEVGDVYFPVHPRTAQQLRGSSRERRLDARVHVSEPLGYFAFLDLLRRVRLVVTDSGGLQEEAAYFGVPVIVLRGSTPRWEGVESGSTILVPLASPDAAVTAMIAARRLLSSDEQLRVANLACPYGDGTTGVRVAHVLADPLTDRLMVLDEPNFVGGRLPW